MDDGKEPTQLECACRDIIKELIENPTFPKDRITQLKNRVLRKYSITHTMKNSIIMEYATEYELEIILPILRRRSTRYNLRSYRGGSNDGTFGMSR